MQRIAEDGRRDGEYGSEGSSRGTCHEGEVPLCRDGYQHCCCGSAIFVDSAMAVLSTKPNRHPTSPIRLPAIDHRGTVFFSCAHLVVFLMEIDDTWNEILI